MPINASQSEIYESYAMYSPEGDFMCYCQKKKASWYVKKGLATWMDDKRFKLVFEPNGKGKSDNPYYTQMLENCCVVCGSKVDLNKHHVVPYVFRSRFPLEYKESNHHDILATCIDCHEAYEEKANIFKKQIANDLNISMHIPVLPEKIKNKKILSAIHTLKKLDSGEIKSIPENKIAVLKNIANQPLQKEVYVNGAVWADEIIDHVLKKDELHQFVKNWRVHFIDTMKPEFLPKHWSVDSALEKSGKLQ